MTCGRADKARRIMQKMDPDFQLLRKFPFFPLKPTSFLLSLELRLFCQLQPESLSFSSFLWFFNERFSNYLFNDANDV